MTPKEKAEKLVNKFNNVEYYDYDGYPCSLYLDAAKQCALIAVDELLSVVDLLDGSMNDILYWQEVKNEIEKL